MVILKKHVFVVRKCLTVNAELLKTIACLHSEIKIWRKNIPVIMFKWCALFAGLRYVVFFRRRRRFGKRGTILRCITGMRTLFVKC